MFYFFIAIVFISGTCVTFCAVDLAVSVIIKRYRQVKRQEEKRQTGLNICDFNKNYNFDMKAKIVFINEKKTEELKLKVREFFESEKDTIIDDLTELFSVSPAGLAFFCEPIATARTKNDDKVEISMLTSNDDILLESENLKGSCLMRLDIASNFMYNILKYCQEGEKNASKT